jgi:hypothetical protein
MLRRGSSGWPLLVGKHEKCPLSTVIGKTVADKMA